MKLKEDDKLKDQLTISELADPSHPGRLEIANNISASVAQFLQRPEIPRYLEAFQRVVEKVMPPTLKFLTEFGEVLLKIQEANRQRSEYYPEILGHVDVLATKTWFVSMSLGLQDYELLTFSPKVIGDTADSDEALNKQFVDVYSENLDYLESVLLEQHPKRAFAIGPAIQAHRRGEYALSIPVFLSQADGILLDLTSAELFTSQGHISEHAQSKMMATAHSSWFQYAEDAMWSPLSVKRPVGWTSKQRLEAGYTGFNRHTVMHGLDLQYASEVNSFKSFSLLSYIASLKGAVDAR